MADPNAVIMKSVNEEKDKDEKNAKLKKFLPKSGSSPLVGSASALISPTGSASNQQPQDGSSVTESNSTKDMPYHSILDHLNLRSSVSRPLNDADTLEDPLDTLRHWRREFPRRYSYLNLYRFSSGLDRLHMIVGIVAAIMGGLCIPTFIYSFGKMTRKMILVDKIQRSMSCTTEPCQKFLATCSIASPFNGRSLDKASLNGVVYNAMSTFSLWAAVSAAGYTICSSVYFICWHVAADNQIGRLRRKYFEALLRKDMTWFDTQTDPESVNKLMDHTRRIREGIGENVPIALNLLIVVISCTLLAFSKAWSLTFLALGLVLILLFISFVVTMTEARKMAAEIRAYKFATDLATEVFQNARTMIFYSGHRKEIIRYKNELNRDFGKVAKWSLLHSITILIYWFITFVSWAVVMWFGVSIVLHDQSCSSSSSPYHLYDAGDIFIVIFSILFGAGNVYLVAPMVYAMRIARKYGTRVFQVIDGPRGIDNMGTEGTIIEPFHGNVEFQDVRFTYPLNKDNVVLNHFSMKVAGGSHVAIVGVSGCGKTSVFKLITKEYLPDSGFIKIDGEDIRNVNTKWLRSQIGYVPQTPVIFDDTVENNVRMGKPDAAFFEIQEACERANAHDFIVSLKGAYQTRVGAGGTKLSAGQRQRLAIARALVRNPKILLLDEHTSSLDPESESLVLDTIQKASLERTVIIITHRLHLAIHCDNIFVIERGKVVEKGIHSHLLRSKGVYSQLASGVIDQPSASMKSVPTLPKFDGSLINIAYLIKLFGVQRAFPSLYNSRLSLNPAVFYVSQIFMKQVVVSNIPMQSVNRPGDDEFYVLENSDSIIENDAALTKSEVDFRETTSRGDFSQASHHRQVNAEAEIEGIVEIFDPSKFSAIQVIGLASRASYNIILFICVVLSICMGFILAVFAVLIARSIEILSNPNLWFLAKNWERVALFKAEDDSVQLFIMFVFLGIASGGVAAILDFCVSMSGYRLTLNLKKKMFANIIRQDLSFFDNPIFNMGALRNFLSIDVVSLRFLVRGMFNVIPQTCTTAIVGVVLAASIYAGNLTAYACVLALFISAINFIDSWFARKQLIANTAAMTEISSLIWQVFEVKHNVTITQLEPFFLEKFTKIHNAAFTERRRITYFRALSFGLSQTSVFWGYAAFIYIASQEIMSGRTNFRATVAIGQLLIFGLIFVGANLAIIPCFKVAISAGKNLLCVMSRNPRIPIERPGAHIDCKGEIGFHDVHFWHPYTGADNPFLKGVTFTVPAGKTVGIVGSSESGKSAYLDLVMRLFDVPSGSITLDDKDLKDLSVRSLRRLIGHVESEPQLFKRSVAENIAYGHYGDNSHKLLMKDIVAAAEMAHMHNFICSLPDGYETRIGAPNERLSAAQKQRICIARAILRRPKILLINEPTKNLDRDGERLVLESLEKAKEGRTCIIVAHRLVVVQKADLIVVMADGLVSEIGTHEELLKNVNGDYAKLWKSQNPLEDESFLNATYPFHRHVRSKVPRVSPHPPGHLPLQTLAAPPNSAVNMTESQVASSSTAAPHPSKTDAADKKDAGCQMCGSFGAR